MDEVFRKERFVPCSGATDDYEPSPDILAAFDRIDQGVVGVHVLIQNVPVEDLEPSPTGLDTWTLKLGTAGSKLASYAVKKRGIVCSTAQKRGPDNFDENGKRKPINHSLIVIVDQPSVMKQNLKLVY